MSNEPKKIDLLGLKKNKPITDNESTTKASKTESRVDEKAEERTDAILTKYKPRAEEYNQIGANRAAEDKKRKDEWRKKEEGYFRTSLFISLKDNEDYEDIRRKSRGGKLRLGYRHIFHYGLMMLKSMSPDDAVKKLVEIEEEFKKLGIVIKE